MKQCISLHGWDIIFYYTPTEQEKKEILSCLSNSDHLSSITSSLKSAAKDTGFTYSDYSNCKSILVIYKSSSLGEFINTIEHEKRHLEMHICDALDVNPYSEEAAHLSGDLSQKMLEDALCGLINI